MSNKTKVTSRETLEETQLRKLGRSFRIKRNDLNWNYLRLQAESGVSSLTLSKLEKGKLQNCSLETLNKVATALSLKIELTVV